MAKTFNRQPLSFDGPDSNDAIVQSFSQSNWKGINENKNFFSTDQESFEDCNNVYVDEDLVLRSRPDVVRILDYDLDSYESFKTQSYIIWYKNTGNERLKILSLTNNVYNIIDVTHSLPDNERLYFYEIGDTLFAFGSSSIYKIVNENGIFSLESALSNLYVPDAGDVKNLLIPKAEKLNINVNADQYEDILLLEDIYNNPTLMLKTNVEDDIEIPWPFDDLSTLRYTLLHKTKYQYKNSGKIFVVINNTPYHFYYYANQKNRELVITLYLESLLDGRISTNTITYTAYTNKLIDLNFNVDLIDTYKTDKLYLIISYYELMPATDADHMDAGVSIIEIDLQNKGLVAELYNYNLLPEYKNNESPNLRLHSLVTGSDGLRYLVLHSSDPTSSSYSSHLTIYQLNSETHIATRQITRVCATDNHYDYNTFFVLYGYYEINPSINSTIMYFAREGNKYEISKITFLENPQTYYVDKTTVSSLKNAVIVDFNGEIYSPTAQPNVITTVLNNGVYAKSNQITDYEKIYYDPVNGFYNLSFVLNNQLSIGSEFFGKRYDVYMSNGEIWIASDYGIFTSAPVSYVGSANIADVDVIYNFSYFQTNDYAPKYPTLITGLKDLFFIVNNESYLLQTINDNGNLKLYLPANKYNNFYENIISAVPLNEKSVIVFTKNSIWHISDTDTLDDNNLPVYSYTKTKLNLNVVDDSTVTVAYDGATLLTPTYQGLAGLSYNQLISTPEQIVQYMSDNIYKRWLNYVSNARIRFCNYKYYLFVYSVDETQCWLFDYRSNTWWLWTFDNPIKFIYNLDNYCFIGFDTFSAYLDENKHCTDWFIRSQKLHLNAPNYNKQIRKFVVYCNGEQLSSMVMNMKFTNYRKRMFEEDTNIVDFDVDFLRTYVAKVNYTNVLHFQYELSNNDMEAKPLELTGITIDYKVGGEIK